MPSDLIRRSLPLRPEEWQRLEDLAKEHHTLAPSGPTTGEPSWRSLVKAIAQGRLTLTRTSKETDTPDD